MRKNEKNSEIVKFITCQILSAFFTILFAKNLYNKIILQYTVRIKNDDKKYENKQFNKTNSHPNGNIKN